MGASSGHHLLSLQKGWYCFVTNKTVTNFSESKHLQYSIGSPTLSEKCVGHLNAANIFNVHTFFVNKTTGVRL